METTKPVRKPEITVKDIGGETLLHSPDGKAIHVLNPTAQLIWEMCDGEHTHSDMEQTLRNRFVIPDEYDVLSDIRRTLETFATNGLLICKESDEP